MNGKNTNDSLLENVGKKTEAVAMIAEKQKL